MTRRLPLVVILVALVASGVDARQATTPQLSKPQRETLRAIVEAVQASAAAPDTPGVNWPMHVMRASDGSHYVAFSVAPAESVPGGPVMMYVRLATAPPSSAQVVNERSAVEEWVTGKRSDPMLRPRSGIVPGEMPNFGAGAIAVRGSTASTGSNDLSLMEMERRRARQEKEDRDRQRKAELEGLERASRNLLPFEDFEVAVTPNGTGRGFERALTAGPGDYFLYVAWADPKGKAPVPVRVMKKSIHLPPASTGELMLSSVIVADRVAVRQQPLSVEEQRSHPYTIGATEITPARDTIFTKDERLAVAFQVINARSSETGKPDVTVNFRVMRVLPDHEQAVATLNPQKYDASSLPADFDLRLGHPIFAAVAAPLSTLARGDYLLRILVTDRISGTAAAGEAAFSVIGTPTSLLAEAPALGRAFQPKDALTPALLQLLVEKLRPASPSPALARALELAQKGQLVGLLQEEPVGAAEEPVRTALTALALLSLGDASSSSVQLQRAMQLNAPPAPTGFLLGAARAQQGRDVDAIAAWQASISAGMPADSLTMLLVDAHLRRGEPAKAEALLAADRSQDPARERARAAVHLASGREADAIAVLEARLAQQPDDAAAEWLLIQALYATLVKTPAAPAANRDRFTKLAEAYSASGGANTPLVSEWLNVLRK